MNPAQAIRKKCSDCNPVKNQILCIDCFLKDKKLSNLKKIKNYCKVFCMNNQEKEVDFCPSKSCPLYNFRKGKNPNRAGIGNHRAKLPKNVS